MMELNEGHLRIIWATWHLASFCGWCIGAFLVKISLEQGDLDSEFIDFIIHSAMYTMVSSSFLVLVGTKGRHSGWITLL